MGDGLCYCNIQLTTGGGMTEHAINCPLRPKVSFHPATFVTPAQAASPFYSSEWQEGYNAGYAAGLAAGGRKLGPING